MERKAKFGGYECTCANNAVVFRKEAAFSVLPWTLGSALLCLLFLWLAVYSLREASKFSTSLIAGLIVSLVAGIIICIWWIRWSLLIALPATIKLHRIMEQITICRKILFFTFRYVTDGPAKLVISPCWGHHGSWGFLLYLDDGKKRVLLNAPMAIAGSKKIALSRALTISNMVAVCVEIPIKQEGWNLEK